MQHTATLAHAWQQQRRPAAVARVVHAEGLGPRGYDQLILIDADGHTAGELLGGATNDDIADEARQLIAAGDAHRLLRLAIGNNDATAAGLTCGGQVTIVIQQLHAVPSELWAAVASGEPAALVTALGAADGAVAIYPGRRRTGTFGDSALDAIAEAEGEALLTQPGAKPRRIPVGTVELLIEAWNPAPQVVILGVNALALAISEQVELLGWHATIFADGNAALELLAGFTPADAVIVLDHDPTLATPVLAAALRRGVGYVGALGSRRTQTRRRDHLAAAGVTDVELERLHGPTGLDLGARTPAETAVSIAAEILAARSGRPAQPLRDTRGSINS